MNLKNWLTKTCKLPDYTVTPLAGDASFRRYFRVHKKNHSYVAMDASKEQSSCIPFIAIANALRAQGLHAPDIIASDLSQGFLLLTDFGDQLYLRELNATNAKTLYVQALDALFTLQHCQSVEGWTVPPFTAEFMYQELVRFQEWFLENYLGLELLDETQQMLNDTFLFLANTAAQQPQVFMHRDYHSANLLALAHKQVGILDFQDAFIGPITYDLVSLLRDCYISWPEELIYDLVLYFWEKLALPNVTEQQFIRWFDLMGMQRHLKCLLTFSRKFCRDHDESYLRHIPRTLNYIQTVGQRYPECQMLSDFLTEVTKEQCVQ